MRKLVIFLSVLLFANNYVVNLIGKKEYQNYEPLFKDFDKNLTLKESIKKLENLGLINLFFEKPKIITTEFVFKNNNPILEAKILYKTLNLMGYYYFYPSKLIYESNRNEYVIDIEMKTNHYINPLIFLDTVENYGCRVFNVVKKDKYYYFYINAENALLPAVKLTDRKKKYINAKGEYWISPNGFKKISIYSSKYDNWYPYIVFYDKNLNILNIIAYKKKCRYISLNIPDYTAYIRVKDNFSKINFKRGISIKGIK